MTLIGLIVFILVIGLALWLVNMVFGLDARSKNILTGLIALIAVLWLLQWFAPGVFDVPLFPKH